MTTIVEATDNSPPRVENQRPARKPSVAFFLN
jgi:hypothetical protein